MLLTQASWEDKNPARSKLFSPYTAFRCVAVPPTCFLIQSRRKVQEDEYPVDTFLATTAEDLLEIVNQLDATSRIFVISTRIAEDGECVSQPLSSIHSYVADGLRWYSYQTSDGNLTQFLPWQRGPDAETLWTTEWSCKPYIECELNQ
jgi:hypothetical protein